MAADGFVLQRRANTTATLAVAVDLSVRSPRSRTTATLVVRPYR